jgi:nitroreductase
MAMASLPEAIAAMVSVGSLRSTSNALGTSRAAATLEANPYADHSRMRLSDPYFQVFYRAPVLILISAGAEGLWIVEDCALAAENLMLAAYATDLSALLGVLPPAAHSLTVRPAWFKSVCRNAHVHRPAPTRVMSRRNTSGQAER